jgi:hypothetical protein
MNSDNDYVNYNFYKNSYEIQVKENGFSITPKEQKDAVKECAETVIQRIRELHPAISRFPKEEIQKLASFTKAYAAHVTQTLNKKGFFEFDAKSRLQSQLAQLNHEHERTTALLEEPAQHAEKLLQKAKTVGGATDTLNFLSTALAELPPTRLKDKAFDSLKKEFFRLLDIKAHYIEASWSKQQRHHFSETLKIAVYIDINELIKLSKLLEKHKASEYSIQEIKLIYLTTINNRINFIEKLDAKSAAAKLHELYGQLKKNLTLLPQELTTKILSIAIEIPQAEIARELLTSLPMADIQRIERTKELIAKLPLESLTEEEKTLFKKMQEKAVQLYHMSLRMPRSCCYLD